MAQTSLAQRLAAPGPKRICAIDGGGVRGVVALAFLERMEAHLAETASSPEDFRLSDYFDLTVGTSTGALIAAGIALGYRMQDLIDAYVTLSKDAFVGSRWHGGLVTPKFKGERLRTTLETFVGDATLGSDALRCGLAIVAKRIDTGSPWILHNSPRGKYYNPPRDDPDAIANKDMRLVDILRASTAAPTYFEPERINVAIGTEGLFVDGGVSPYNNPALLAFQLAVMRAYGLEWSASPDRLRLFSIGTGAVPAADHQPNFRRSASAVLALFSLMSLIDDSSNQTQALLQWIGETPDPWHIDGELGTLSEEDPPFGKLLTYVRYDAVLNTAWLDKEAGLSLPQKQLSKLQEWDRPEIVADALSLGRAVAARQVKSDHLQ